MPARGANRSIIVRRLLGLEPVLSMGLCGPTHDADSWTFDPGGLDPGGLDPVLGIPRLKDAYEARSPGYQRGITVPAIVDVPTGAVVTNDFSERLSGQRYLVGDTVTEAHVRLFTTLARFDAVRLDGAARPGVARRPPVRRRHAARPAAGGRAGADGTQPARRRGRSRAPLTDRG